MRWLSTATILSVAAGHASGACPYARQLGGEAAAAQFVPPATSNDAQARDTTTGTSGVFYFNRIAPGSSQLYIANADGSDAQPLMSNQTWVMDYHPSWSPDGNWIVFTSERRADGQADVYRVKPDGTGLETLVSTDSFEDSGTLSPDGTKLAYVSTQGNYTTNIWVMDLATGTAQNLTDTEATRPDKNSPQGHYRPAWSPDGEWIAFSSDRNTEWTGHGDGTGWEHTQTLSIYVIRPDGSDLRQVVSEDGYSLGTPAWSPDGSRILYNRVSREDTYSSHGTAAQMATITGQIASVDVATGTDVVNHTTGDYLKVGQHYIGSTDNIGYLIKGGDYEGIHYTEADDTHKDFNLTWLRDPSWSPDGSQVVYEVVSWDQRAPGRELFSWDSEWEYRFIDVFPMLNNATHRIAFTQKQLGNSSAVISDADFTDPVDAFEVYDLWSPDNATELTYIESGLGGAFQPTFSPDGSQIAVGFGTWFFDRGAEPGTIYVANATGDSFEDLTQTPYELNAGFPSWSPDGSRIVYRLWNRTSSSPLGLRVLDLTTGETSVLTTGWDNTPGWSPDGELIVFTRQVNWTAEYGSRWYEDRFDIMTIRPDGTDLNRVTDSPANDAHAVWSYDGRIMWSSGMYGFRDECVLFDNTFQPYGQIMVMNADGSDKRMVTDSLWEDSMPMYVPNEYLTRQ